MWRHADVAGVSNNTFLVLLAVESELSRTGGSHWNGPQLCVLRLAVRRKPARRMAF